MTDVAIIGSGIAGLGAAYKLSQRAKPSPYAQISIYESNDYVGGHSNTALVKDATAGEEIPIDTGFMVFNQVTYPQLTELFKNLGVAIEPTDMSFSVQHRLSGLEYAGASLGRLFGQRRNIVNPRFWRLLMQLDRFNKEAHAALAEAGYDEMTLADYVRARGYGDDLLELYLVPMASAVWSTPPAVMLKFPAKTLLHFFYNHGFLGMDTQHQWWTVSGGSRNYVKRMLEIVKPSVKLNQPAKAIVRRPHFVEVITEAGPKRHDKVILATHADQALRLLQSPEALEEKLLRPFKYQNNSAILHTDKTVMPGSRPCWASWNYRVEKGINGQASTHYWMNSLQNLGTDKQYFVSINGEHLVDPKSVLRTFAYEHPLFSLEARQAQYSLPQLNQQSPDQNVFFCGSYFRYGFHEDALVSGYAAAEAISQCAVVL